MLSFVDISPGNSFFKLIPSFWHSMQSNDRAVHRLFTLMRKCGVNSAVLEELSEEYWMIKDEFEALDIYFDKKLNKSVYRISASEYEIKSIEDLNKYDAQDIFLSSSIIINFEHPEKGWLSYLFSSIFTIPKMKISERKSIPLLNNYIHSARNFDCELIINTTQLFKYKIFGTYFCQQNTYTSVCAQASLCMTLNNLGISTPTNIVTTEYINRECGIDHKKNKNHGLTSDEISSFLLKVGLSVNHMDFFMEPNVDYAEFLYRHLEGSFPTLLIFSTTADGNSHIVPIIGHTLNSDMWRPEAEFAYNNVGNLEYRPASAWVDHFVIHDDNFGMYCCLPVDSLRRSTLPKYDPAFRAIHGIAIVPKNVTASSYSCEFGSIKILKNINQFLIQQDINLDLLPYWLKMLLSSAKKEGNSTLVARTFLCRKNIYKESLGFYDFDGSSFEEEEKEYILSMLTGFFYITEISITDLYTANKSKLADVIFRCDARIDTFDDIFNNWIFVRLPGILLHNDIESKNVGIMPLSVKSHYPLVRNDHGYIPIEW